MIKHLIIPITTIILLAVNVLLGVLLINLSNESQISRSHLEALRQNRLHQEQLETDLLANEPQITELSQVLPTEDKLPEFIQFVTDTGKKQGIDLTLNFATNQPSKNKSGLYFIPFVITFQAEPTKLPNLITTLQSNLYQLRFNHLEVVPTATTGTATIKLTGDVYVKNPV